MDKYDRQLRLWGADGQRALMSTHILLINASATGAETLKNLVLPGVQHFTILDAHRVTQADVTNNFFVSSACLGQPRAQVVTDLLLEMNRDVAGSFRVADPFAIAQHEPHFFDQFQLVIATQVLDETLATLLGQRCAARGLPLLVVNAYGLLGHFRLQVTQHAVLDAKPDPPRHELRLARPFPALVAFAAQFDLHKLATIDHAHVPFVVLLLQAMDTWKRSHQDTLPTTVSDKHAFKQLLQGMAWGGVGHEVNFMEASEHAYKAYSSPIVPDEVEQVLAAARHMVLTDQTEEFWFLARGLAEFVDAHDGLLPVTGVVPDMTASTDTYVALQQVYVTKAKQDAGHVRTLVHQHLADAGLPTDKISDDRIDAFCKNAYNIAMLATRSIEDELHCVDLSSIDVDDEDPQQSPVIWYLLLRAVGAFTAAFQRYPGSDAASLDADADWLVEKAQALARGSAIASWVTRAHANEMTRACEVELHTIAALMGGVAAQEAVKIITHQFLPLNHTYVFNGIAGLAGTYDV